VRGDGGKTAERTVPAKKNARPILRQAFLIGSDVAHEKGATNVTGPPSWGYNHSH
jgi:hypothetical protein